MLGRESELEREQGHFIYRGAWSKEGLCRERALQREGLGKEWQLCGEQRLTREKQLDTEKIPSEKRFSREKGVSTKKALGGKKGPVDIRHSEGSRHSN